MKNTESPSTELTKLEYALIHSTWEPSDDEIRAEYARDKNLNPYNEMHKPKLRSRYEIIKDLKIKYFSLLLN